MSGRMLSERLGRWNFWLVLIGFNATFLVQHSLGLMGMPRRVYTYPDEPGWALLNGISTAGALLIAVGVVFFVVNLALSLRRGKLAGNNPWGAFTLEWLTTSPPPKENFELVPTIRDRRPVWGLDHPELADWRVSRSPEDRRREHSKSKLAVGFFLQSETMFFLLLLVAYVIYNNRSMEGPTSSTALDVPRTGFFTVCLLASSGTIWLAERHLRRGNRRAFLTTLGITIALGVVFLCGQAIEYAGLLGDSVTMSRNLFAATFFGVTGFHGLHVFGGVVALGVLFALARSKGFDQKRADTVSAIAMYWHFVDVVWIAVFSIIYLGVLT
jgi:heme/copper-type cytochrome/quinol oxidase subunit 3